MVQEFGDLDKAVRQIERVGTFIGTVEHNVVNGDIHPFVYEAGVTLLLCLSSRF
jgi:hypothetical protein